MKAFYLLIIFVCLSVFNASADRMYVVNSRALSHYTWAGPEIITALINNGHSVVVDSTILNALPAGFTSTCIDPTNGFDWLCFFGEYDYSILANDIKAFIDVGGKVYYQYEVGCCQTSTNAVCAVASSVTGLTIVPSGYVSISGTSYPQYPGWQDTMQNNCISFTGNAYRCLLGIPAANQLNATTTINGGYPPFSFCTIFGFHFATTDFSGTADNGAMIGLGDINLFYDGDEPFSTGGSHPVNMDVINFFFPNDTSRCALLSPGCLTTDAGNLNYPNNIIQIFPIPSRDILTLKFLYPVHEGRVDILSVSGQLIYSENFHHDSNLELNLKNISKGIYIVKVYDGMKYFFEKVAVD